MIKSFSNGDTGAVARAAINGNFAEVVNRFGRPANAVVLCTGDSKTDEPRHAMMFVAARLGLQVDLPDAQLGLGGSDTGTQTSFPAGLTSPDRIAALQAAIQQYVAKGKVVDVSIKIGTNSLGNGADAVRKVGDLRKLIEQVIRPAGARYVLLWAVDPREGGAVFANAVANCNRLYAAYADTTNDVLFIDTTNYLVDPANAGSPLWQQPAAAEIGSVSTGGLHLNWNGSLVQAPAIEPFMRLAYPEDGLAALRSANAYDAMRAPYGNIFGAIGRTAAVGGTSNLTNTGTGAIVGTPPAGFTLTGKLTGTLGLKMTQVTVPALDAKFGHAGFGAVRFEFSGTASEDQQFEFNTAIYDHGLTTAAEVRAALAFYANDCSGLHGLRTALLSVGWSAGWAAELYAEKNNALQHLNGFHRFVSVPLALTSTPGGFYAGFQLQVKAGVPQSGSVDLLEVGTYRTPTVPPAAV